MSSQRITYQFSNSLWCNNPNGGWHFISLPKELSKEIRQLLGKFEEGWGRLKVNVLVKNSEWETALWFDTKHNTYLLPIKANIRSQHQLKVGDLIAVVIKV